jgi:hypothetical protein
MVTILRAQCEARAGHAYSMLIYPLMFMAVQRSIAEALEVRRTDSV